MPLANQMSALSGVQLLDTVSAANTAAATSAYVDLSGLADDFIVVVYMGTITGTCDITWSTASDVGGTGAATVVPQSGALAQITTSNDNAVYIARFEKKALKGFLKIIGTIATGPSLISAVIVGRQKTV